HAREPSALAIERVELRRIAEHLRIAEQLLELGVATNDRLELADRDHVAGTDARVSVEKSSNVRSLVNSGALPCCSRSSVTSSADSATSSCRSSGSIVVIFCTKKPGHSR